MDPHTDMWVEFAKSFGMLFVVLALFLIILYLVRRFSGRFGTQGPVELIKVLSVHHLSPKEKLVLVSVLDESVLIGVSPAGISSLARFDTVPATELASGETAPGFQSLLKKNLNKGNSLHKQSPKNDDSHGGKGEGP